MFGFLSMYEMPIRYVACSLNSEPWHRGIEAHRGGVEAASRIDVEATSRASSLVLCGVASRGSSLDVEPASSLGHRAVPVERVEGAWSHMSVKTASEPRSITVEDGYRGVKIKMTTFTVAYTLYRAAPLPLKR